MEKWQHNIIDIFKTKIVLTKHDSDHLLSKWNKKVMLARKEFLVQKGQVERFLYYVVSGRMRIFYPHKTEEVCVGFAYDHNLICAYPSFIQQEPSAYFIQALSRSELMAISRQDFYSIFDDHPAIERGWRMLEEEALLGKIEREVELLTFTPEERYVRLMKRSPHIFQKIPKKYIASYLRMTPETLSRIRLA